MPCARLTQAFLFLFFLKSLLKQIQIVQKTATLVSQSKPSGPHIANARQDNIKQIKSMN